MRKYSDGDERNIRTERLVREWVRSGLLSQGQLELILPSLRVELRRTNAFLRAILFGFGIFVILASVLLAGVTSGIRTDSGRAALCLVAAVACMFMAEILIGEVRLYRFGVEEAAAIGSIVLLGLAGMFTAESQHARGEFPAFAGLVVAGIAGMGTYWRFGYLSGALLSMFCIGIAPFQTNTSPVVQRLMAAGILFGFFIVSRSKRRGQGDEFPGDEYGTIQAVAWLGMYAALNLMPITRYLGGAALHGSFYWFTYAMIWILPAAGLILAIREKDRPLLDANVVLALATLATNKLYLDLPRQTWDPILLGLLLAGTAIGLRRWLGTDGRRGFTAARILHSDKQKLSVVGTASAALHTMPGTPAAPEKPFESGGGRSGGGGAGGSF